MKHTTVLDLIRQNPSCALVLDEYGINHLEHGDKTLEQICAEKQVDCNLLQSSLGALGSHVYSIDFNLVSIPFLIEYLINTHHDYAKTKLPAIRKVVALLSRYDEGYRELEKTFRKFSNQMRKHIILEEEVVFPFILKLQALYENYDREGVVELLGKYSTEILCHNHEHDEDEMHELRVLTNNFRYKSSDDLNYQITMHELLQLQTDMGQHAKIEENVLFKKAAQMEAVLRKKLKNA
ncbi:MAG: hemerythrin domain-containing protein [Bacteroidota bacterium]